MPTNEDTRADTLAATIDREHPPLLADLQPHATQAADRVATALAAYGYCVGTQPHWDGHRLCRVVRVSGRRAPDLLPSEAVRVRDVQVLHFGAPSEHVVASMITVEVEIPNAADQTASSTFGTWHRVIVA